jgi:hypothetical protein
MAMAQAELRGGLRHRPALQQQPDAGDQPGAVGARLLGAFKAAIEQPVSLLI